MTWVKWRARTYALPVRRPRGRPRSFTAIGFERMVGGRRNTMTTRYRADHVGSLLRPTEVLQARESYARGALGLEELRQVEDNAILDALTMQREAGLDVVSDGEFRRASWLTDLADAVEGFVPNPVVLEWRGP